MRKNQWYVLGIAFWLLMMLFIYQDYSYEVACGGFAGHGEKSFEPLLRYELWCINTEILDPFIYFFMVMSVACWINGWLEGRAEKKG
jgi:hypothetical protein